MNYIEMVRKMRPLMVQSAEQYDDDTAADVPYMYNPWAVDTAYQVNDRVRYGEKLYKVLQAHTSQASWTPDTAVSLFAEVINEGIPEWVQPGSTNPYMKGDKVKHNDKKWESDIDNNVWEPGVYGWTEI